MAATRRVQKRSRPPRVGLDRVYHVRVSQEAGDILERAAQVEQLPVGTHIRRVLYRALGLYTTES